MYKWDPLEALKMIDEHKPQKWNGVPTMVQAGEPTQTHAHTSAQHHGFFYIVFEFRRNPLYTVVQAAEPLHHEGTKRANILSRRWHAENNADMTMG